MADASELVDRRRSLVVGNAVLWGDVHFSPEVGLCVSSDGHAYLFENVRYAAALLEEVAGGGKSDSGPETRGRAVAILRRSVDVVDAAVASRERPPIVFDRGASVVLSGRRVESLLAIFAYLLRQRASFRLPDDLADRLGETVDKLGPALPVSVPSGSAVRRDPWPEVDRTASGFFERLEAALGVAFHWAYLEPEPLGMALDVPVPVGLSVPCAVQPCTEGPACHAGGYIPVLPFRGARDIAGRYPVIFTAGWQFQIHRHSTGWGFGEGQGFSTLAPPWSPTGNGSNHEVPPPVIELETSLPAQRDFKGLSTMLKCAAGYDHVRWEQSQPAGPIDISVNELHQVVNATKQLFGVDKVILVGHSRGGLISRKYVLDKWRDRWNDGGGIDVAKVITYGTPHLGAELVTVGEQVLTDALVGVLLDLIDPIAGTFDLAVTLELIGNLLGDQAKEAVEHDLLQLVSPIVESYWTNFTDFVNSGEEMRPDSPFIEDLNAGYADAQVVVKGETLSLWEAIPHVLIAGTSPDFITLWLGSWLENFTILGWLEALEPHTGWTTIHVLGTTIEMPWVYYPWHWYWRPLVRIMGDLAPLIPALSLLDTFKEGRGDSLVARTSAWAEGVVGPRRAEFKLHHMNIYNNSEQTTSYQNAEGDAITVNPWQLLFLELGIDELFTPSTLCTNVQGCGTFNMTDALP